MFVLETTQAIQTTEPTTEPTNEPTTEMIATRGPIETDYSVNNAQDIILLTIISIQFLIMALMLVTGITALCVLKRRFSNKV